jgi:hypothetical protein
MSYSTRAPRFPVMTLPRADAEQPVRQRHRLARELRRHEWSREVAAIALDAARHHTRGKACP